MRAQKNLFSFLLVGTFATYALYLQQFTQSHASAPIVLERNLVIPETPAASAPPLVVPRQELAPPVRTQPIQTPPPQTTPIQQNPTPPPQPIQKPKGLYRDGTYVGSNADAYYGNVQVQVVVQNNKVADVQFLDHPQDRSTSVRINEYAMPLLRTEAIQAQQGNVDVVSGATATSHAFIQSLTDALAQAKN